MAATPWAILRCKWSDTPEEPEPDSFFRRLFTPEGAGTRNMVEFFDLMSHGNVDVSGSEVFGWFTFPNPLADWVGNVPNPDPGKINRYGLLNLAVQAANDNGVDLSRFFGFIVCMNVPTDLFGGTGGTFATAGGLQVLGFAVCSPGSFQPTVLGQEMGHGYGLDHSRIEGSTADYTDRWDVMSTWGSQSDFEHQCFYVADSDYTLIGPGMNAANMRGRGWLDENRLHAPPIGVQDVVELRPLHRRDLPGLLAAQAGSYLVEFRVDQAWDAGFPRAAVFVHYFVNNQSYVCRGASGSCDLVEGDVVERSSATDASRVSARIEVQSIDVANLTATVALYYDLELTAPHFWPPAVPQSGPVELAARSFAVGDRAWRLEPEDAMGGVLEHLADYAAVASVRDTHARRAVQVAALREIAELANAQLEELTELESPPNPPGERELPPSS